MYNKIILAGGSGFIGNVLAYYYCTRAKEVVILSRNPHSDENNIRHVVWDGKEKGEWANELEGADLLINLCGKNVNCRYTHKNKEEIFRSRLEPTVALGKALQNLSNPPSLWIQIASATIYRHAEDHYQDEHTGEIGSGFSVDVCKAWEFCFWNCITPRTRKIILRTGIVLGRKDGVLLRLKNMVQFGLGGKQGNGRQYFSWIHEQDLARITEWLIVKGKDGEVYNAAAPVAHTNEKLMKLMRQLLGVRFGFPAPRWLLEMGALLIGTETELVLKSRWVYPAKLLERGFSFSFADLRTALEDLLQKKIQP
ncbi:MAG: TIGR01777 family oxidoreductase [Flavisolibacter sp.]